MDEKVLDEFREDIRKAQPDGTQLERRECPCPFCGPKGDLGLSGQDVFEDWTKDLEPCPPKYLDVLSRRWTEMLG